MNVYEFALVVLLSEDVVDWVELAEAAFREDVSWLYERVEQTFLDLLEAEDGTQFRLSVGTARDALAFAKVVAHLEVWTGGRVIDFLREHFPAMAADVSAWSRN
ncbi:MAG: hypothetical protein D6812_02920 [Deltaproteobacteria bacterium]|nr:MAG: hypothetical protein D6812_02920 [Deltaproteobacteria bacterium]